MFMCEILTEQQQAPPPVIKTPAPNVHVHVHQPSSPEKKAEPKPKVEEQPQQVAAPVQQVVPVQQVQQPDYGDYGEYDPDLDDGGEMAQPSPFQEILPLKRYYLILRLKELKSQLDDNNIKNADFDTIIKFVNNLSYNSIVMLSNGIIPVVEEQIARLRTNV